MGPPGTWHRRLATVVGGAVLLITFGAVSASASVIFTIGGADYSDPTDNTGGSIKVTITDVAGGVDLNIENNLVDPGAFLDDLYLNTTAAPLAAAVGSCLACGSINGAVSVDFGRDAFKAGGGGRYDLLIDFAQASKNRLTPGESVVLRILSTTAGFNAASFRTLAAPHGGNGTFEAAAHIASLPLRGSDFVAGASVPEPTTLVLFLAGLLGTAGVRARRRS